MSKRDLAVISSSDFILKRPNLKRLWNRRETKEHIDDKLTDLRKKD